MEEVVEDPCQKGRDGGQLLQDEVDYDYWGRMPGWTMSEAAALLLGYDPDGMNPAEDKQHEPGSAAWKYRRLLRVLQRACEMDELSSPEIPQVLLEWARSNKIDRPQLLVGRVRASGRVHNWS